MNFRKKYSFEKRFDESSRIIKKYPDRLPIIVEKEKNSKVPDIDKHKYLVPTDLTMGQFMYVIRKRIKMESNKALFLFINGKIINNTCFVEQVYQTEKNQDNFLYVTYCSENVFG